MIYNTNISLSAPLILSEPNLCCKVVTMILYLTLLSTSSDCLLFSTLMYLHASQRPQGNKMYPRSLTARRPVQGQSIPTLQAPGLNKVTIPSASELLSNYSLAQLLSVFTLCKSFRAS
jgi:hypothetical protein